MIEVMAFIFSLLSVILAVKNNILTWPLAIIGTVSYFIVFRENELVGNMYLQVLFLVQSIQGWYNWNRISDSKLTWLSNYNRHRIVIILILLFILLYSMLPFFDAITTSLSIVAILLLSYKKIENWILWVIADIIYVYLFIIENLYLSALLYSLFFILAIIGFFQWRKIIKNEKI